MPSPMVRLEDLLRRRAREDAANPLYVFVDGDGEITQTLSAADLLDAASELGDRLARAGADDGRVLIVVEPGPMVSIGLFACFIAGAVAVPLYPPGADVNASSGAIAAVTRGCQPHCLVTTRSVADRLVPPLAAMLGDAMPRLIVIGEADKGDTAASHAAASVRPSDLALILYTSGSTGNPKGVSITHEALLTNLTELAAAHRHGRADIVCSWLPHANIAGLYLPLYAMITGSHAVLIQVGAFMQRPALWLQTIARHRAAISAAPNFAYAVLAQSLSDVDLQGLDLSSWRMVISGGEVVRAAVMDRFFEILAPAGLRADAFRPYYGLTETLCTALPIDEPAARLTVSRTGIVHSRLDPPRDGADAITLVGNGPPMGTAIVEVVNPATGRRALPGQIGELWTRGPGVTHGYWGETGERAWEGRLDETGHTYFRTGDLGVVIEGQVFITGRLKELIIVRGKNHYPADIEATCLAALAHLGIRGVAAFTVLQEGEEALGLAFETPDAAAVASPLLRAVRPAVSRAHGLAIASLSLLPVGALPRTVTGKIARHACRTRVEGGDWDAYAAVAVRRAASASTGADQALRDLPGWALIEALLARISTCIEPEVQPQADLLERPFAEFGLSSLALARLIAELRQLTGVEPPLAPLFDGSSPRMFAEIMAGLMTGVRSARTTIDGWRDDVTRMAIAMPDMAFTPLDDAGPDKAILLTGATGFLGAWLLASLLKTIERPVICLVRARDEAEAAARIERACAAGPGWDPAWRGRVTALPGDVAQPALGLGEAGFLALAERLAVIVHNAANVNFVAPYSALHGTNVAPMHELVRLATIGGRARTLHLVSTLAVFNDSNRREQRLVRSTDRLVEPDYLYSGYAQSKWTAEALARVACSRGVPWGLHRPGLIIGASTDGKAHVDDFLCRFVKGAIELGVYPDAAIELDLVPVDEVALGIAMAVAEPVNVQKTFHWSTDNPVSVEAFFDVFRARGHTIEPEPTARWLDRIRTGLPPGNALFPVHPFLLEQPPGSNETILELLDGLPLDIERTEAHDLRQRWGVTAPGATTAVLDRMVAWMQTSGFLPTPRR